MTPIEKLRADVLYWEMAEREAREALKIAESVLPTMRQELLKFEKGQGKTPLVVKDGATMVRPTVSPPAPGESPRFRGDCIQQVEQALAWKAPQSSHDLRDNLAAYGRAYGLGAINGALRLLEQHGKLRQAKKEGNLRFYAPKGAA